MAVPVKTRRYNSSRRRAQAEATRQAILDAAQRLFEQNGYGATSMPDIAKDAGVAIKTIYLYVDSKPGLCARCGRPASQATRPPCRSSNGAGSARSATSPTPSASCACPAQGRRVKTKSGSLLEMIRTAGSSDPEIAKLWEAIEAKLLMVQQSIVEQLHDSRSLAPSLDIATATDILWTLNHPAQWQLLVRGRGWTGEQYEHWLGDVFCSQLLNPDR